MARPLEVEGLTLLALVGIVDLVTALSPLQRIFRALGGRVGAALENGRAAWATSPDR